MSKGHVLFLGYNPEQTKLIKFVEAEGYFVEYTARSVSSLSKFDVVISYGYRRIISDRVLKTAKRPIINLHISYLPYNRGAHPNFWSFHDSTPAGVTIHEIDHGIDTGPIICQRKVQFKKNEDTFKKTYIRLRCEIEALFMENSTDLLEANYIATPQVGDSTFHRKSDIPCTLDGWDRNIEKALAEIRIGKRS